MKSGQCTILALLILTCVSCRQATVSSTPASNAYSDGFEAVVFDLFEGNPTNARSIPLKDAEAAIAAGAYARIPGNATKIASQIPIGTGDSNVRITIQQLEGDDQRVQLAFHESTRTYVYVYDVRGNQLVPVQSEYRDLSRSKVVPLRKRIASQRHERVKCLVWLPNGNG